VVATFLFLVCILGATQKGAPAQFAGMDRVNIGRDSYRWNQRDRSFSQPGRSLGPAIIGMGTKPAALGQVWLFIIAPLIGGGIAGLLFNLAAFSWLIVAEAKLP
jgi:aquaporin Z